MIVLVKLLLLASLTTIFYQDLRDRMVWAALFPLTALCGTYLFYKNSDVAFYAISVFINIGAVSIIVLINYVVARFILKKNFLKEVLGIGDVIFFVAFGVSFPPITFINFFVFSILFTFVFHTVLKNTSSSWCKYPPLAGCMSLFLIAVYVCKWLGLYEPIYTL